MTDIQNDEIKKSLLILCAGAKSYHDDFGLVEPLLNIGNSLVIDRIKKRFISKNLKVYIAYNKEFGFLKSLEPFKGMHFINVGNTKGVIETINISLKYIAELNIEVLPITTIPDQKNINEKAIYFGENEIFKEDWSSLKYLENGKVKFINKRNKSRNFETTYPFTGRISATKMDLNNAIKFISEKEKKDLINLAKILYLKFNYAIVHEKWFDLGHSITYLDTKNQDISSRAFNKLIYNKEKDTIVKTSKNNLIITNEKDYYNNLPNKYKRYFPHILINKEDNYKRIEMEYISFPNLAEIFLFRNMGPNFWNKLLKSLNKIYKDFYKDKKPLENGNLSCLYSHKLKNRTAELENFFDTSDYFKNGSIFKEKFILNDELVIPSLKETIEENILFLESFEKNRPLYFGHGDLCFNNILVEPLSNSVKLIDPKAFKNKINNKIGLIDPIYDLAKLNHSFCCLYDSIVNNLFILEKKKNRVKFFVLKPLNYDVANFYFKQIFGLKIIESKTVRLITSSLFLSMLPIHKDSEKRVLAFSVIGICLFHNININKLIKKL